MAYFSYLLHFLEHDLWMHNRSNVLFPTWEHIIPSVGTNHSQRGNIYETAP